jgi:hypothetical protein
MICISIKVFKNKESLENFLYLLTLFKKNSKHKLKYNAMALLFSTHLKHHGVIL